MKKFCAWCKREMGEVDNPPGRPEAVTAGMCSVCQRECLTLPMATFLENLPVPVLLVESRPRVYAANSLGRAALRRTPPQFEGRKPDDVIQCVHVGKPGACGRDVHCKSCTIRMTALESYNTGRTFRRVPAYPDVYVEPDRTKATLAVSTCRVRDLVLVRVDPIGS